VARNAEAVAALKANTGDRPRNGVKFGYNEHGVPGTVVNNSSGRSGGGDGGHLSISAHIPNGGHLSISAHMSTDVQYSNGTGGRQPGNGSNGPASVQSDKFLMR
jgi:hypothetical protein